MKWDNIDVQIDQIVRPKETVAPSRFVPESIRPLDTTEYRTEVVYQAHIFARSGDHHGEGPTPAQALVNAALHWERHSR